MSDRADGQASTVVGLERSVARAAAPVRDGTIRLDQINAEIAAAVQMVTGDKGISPWAFVWCVGHGAGRHSRLRLRIRGELVSVEFDTRGALLEEVFETEDGSGDAGGYAEGGDPSRLRFMCPEPGCGRSGSRNAETLREALIAALLRHRLAHAEGRARPARLPWWNTPAA